MSKWRLEKEFRFEAAHQLPFHDGKCKRLHGHSWVGRLVCEGTQLHETGSEKGMLLDFGRMKESIHDLLENYLDHYFLNESLKIENPTSEEIARWIYRRTKTKLPELTQVIIDETCTCRCVYEE